MTSKYVPRGISSWNSQTMTVFVICILQPCILSYNIQFNLYTCETEIKNNLQTEKLVLQIKIYCLFLVRRHMNSSAYFISF